MEVHNLKKALFVLGGLLAVFILWRPSFYGAFYFDDWPNLVGLGQINDAGSFFGYVFNATSSFVGRPLSYLSFALQSGAWPDNPAQFKIVNFVLHVLNGGLAAILSRQLLLLTGGLETDRGRLFFLPLLIGLIWLCLPIHSNSVPYVVQRMTLLSGFFSLLAIVSYLHFRMTSDTWNLRKVALVSLVFAGLSLIGILSKENAVLNGLFILAAELTVIKRQAPFKLFKHWLTAISVGPILLVLALLILSGQFDGVERYRDFSIWERFLTQHRIILDYLKAIFVPTPSDLNLYNDSYQVSKGVLDPWYTGLSMALIWVVSIFSLVFRKKLGWLAFGWLFFVFGHSLESTVIPLELYFEHRNYLPSLGLVVGLVVPISLLFRKMNSKKPVKIFLLAAVVSYFTYLSAVLYSETTTWGSPKAFALAGISERPDSLRARQEAANFMVEAGEYDFAARILFSMKEKMNGGSIGISVQLLILECIAPDLIQLNKAKLINEFATSKSDRIVVEGLYHLRRLKNRGLCGTLSNLDIIALVDALISNENFGQPTENLIVVKASLLADSGRFEEAASHMEPYVSRFGLEFGVLYARFLAAAGHNKKAIEVLGDLESRFSGTIKFRLAFSEKFSNWRNEWKK